MIVRFFYDWKGSDVKDHHKGIAVYCKPINWLTNGALDLHAHTPQGVVLNIFNLT